MALQFCSNTLLLTGSVQLLRAEEKKGRKKRALNRKKTKKALGVIQSAYWARISDQLFAVLGYIENVIFITKTHIQEIKLRKSHMHTGLKTPAHKQKEEKKKNHIHKRL